MRGHDRSQQAVDDLVKNSSGRDIAHRLVKKLQKPRAVWLMVPAAVVDEAIAIPLPLLEAGDILIDGGNSYYIDDIRRAKARNVSGGMLSPYHSLLVAN
jgi:6-phosphogluconate dehydrogenase